MPSKHGSLRARAFPRPLVAVAIQLYVLQGLNFLVPLLTLPYLLRVLGPQTYGSIAFAQALVGYAVVITDYGFPLTAARDISVARANSADVARIYWTTMLTKALLLLCSCAIVAVVVAVVPEFRLDWPVFTVCAALVVGNVLFPIWYLQGTERLRQAAFLQLASRCIATAGIFIFVRSSMDVLTAAFLMSAPLLIAFLIAIMLGMTPAPALFYKPKIADLRRSIGNGWHVFAGSISTTLYLQSNTFVLGLLADKRAVAYFSVGYNIVLAVQGLSTPAIQSVFPRVSFLFTDDPRQAWSLVRNLALILFPVIGIASLLMALFAESLVELIAGHSYAESVRIIRIMAILPLVISLAAILGPTVMMNVSLSRQLMRIYFFVGLLNVLLLPYLVLTYAAAGAAMSLVIAETFGPLAMLYVLRTHRRNLPG